MLCNNILYNLTIFLCVSIYVLNNKLLRSTRSERVIKSFLTFKAKKFAEGFRQIMLKENVSRVTGVMNKLGAQTYKQYKFKLRPVSQGGTQFHTITIHDSYKEKESSVITHPST